VNSEASNIIDISKFHWRREANTSNVTAIAFFGRVTTEWSVRTEHVPSGALNASVIQRLNPEAELSRFLDVCSKVLTILEKCSELLEVRDALGADDRLMASKPLLTELVMFRDISDSVGLLVLKCFQAVSQVKAISDVPRLPEVLRRALNRLWAAPFMEFDEACDLADEIDAAANPISFPGYVELTNELVSDARSPEHA
jgi:hypothetical protein